MNNPNSQNKLPEVRGRSRELEIGERQHLADNVERGWVAIKAALSMTADAHYVPGSYERSMDRAQTGAPAQPQAPMADRLRQTVAFNPVQTETDTRHLGDSQMGSTRMGSHDPEIIRDFAEQTEPDPLALQEQAKAQALEQLMEAYRLQAGVPENAAEVPATAEPVMTPLQQAEQQFPDNAYYLVGDVNLTMGDIRSQVGEAYEETEGQA